MITVFLFCLALSPLSQSQPPRDHAAALQTSVDPAAREAELQKQIATAPTDVMAYLALSSLQEKRGAVSDAETTLQRARLAAPARKEPVAALAGFFNRRGDFTKTIEMLETLEHMDPVDPASAQTTASFYWEKAYKDSSLLPSDRYQYVLNGIAATDRAIAIKPDFADALTYKNLLLRMRANLETDPVLQQQLIREADSLRNRAIELNKQRSTTAGSATPYQVLPELPPPPPPPAPPAPGSEMAPVRVGGNVKVPTKLKDVRPDYPSDAMAARIEGVVIIEAVISTDGRVSNARVLRSIPQLDDAAVAAVRQWEFTQTLLNGVPVPVIMTVTVNFTLQ